MRRLSLLVAFLFSLAASADAAPVETPAQCRERVHSPIRSTAGSVSLEWAIDASDAIVEARLDEERQPQQGQVHKQSQEIRVVWQAGDPSRLQAICELYEPGDKIAFFLNHYMMLGIPEKRISFRHVWRDKETGPVRAEFSNSENWPFRGLYWLSKDLFEKDFKDMTEPDARDLHDLRNHLEHKYVKVRSMIVPMGPAAGTARDPFLDNLAHSVSRDDLERRGLRILKLARAALIYLSLGMHNEERGRRESAGPDSILAQMPLTEMEDEWKRRW